MKMSRRFTIDDIPEHIIIADAVIEASGEKRKARLVNTLAEPPSARIEEIPDDARRLFADISEFILNEKDSNRALLKTGRIYRKFKKRASIEVRVELLQELERLIATRKILTVKDAFSFFVDFLAEDEHWESGYDERIDLHKNRFLRTISTMLPVIERIRTSRLPGKRHKRSKRLS